MTLLKFLIMFLSSLFLLTNHPLTMGLILIIQTIMMSLLIGMMSQTFWFSYILFLIMIGGLLILFMYTISLIFNKIFLQKPNIKWLMIILFVNMLLMSLNFKLSLNNFDINFSLFNFFSNESTLNLIKLYNFPMNLLNMMMINYLFYLLVVVVKITNFFYGPLRMKF